MLYAKLPKAARLLILFTSMCVIMGGFILLCMVFTLKLIVDIICAVFVFGSILIVVGGLVYILLGVIDQSLLNWMRNR